MRFLKLLAAAAVCGVAISVCACVASDVWRKSKPRGRWPEPQKVADWWLAPMQVEK